MEKKNEKTLNDFLGDENTNQGKKKTNNKEVVMNEREGLIERVDPIYVTKDGKQLLRERY